MHNEKSILITGGTGSFGKKFTEIILQRYPNLKTIRYGSALFGKKISSGSFFYW